MIFRTSRRPGTGSCVHRDINVSSNRRLRHAPEDYLTAVAARKQIAAIRREGNAPDAGTAILDMVALVASGHGPDPQGPRFTGKLSILVFLGLHGSQAP